VAGRPGRGTTTPVTAPGARIPPGRVAAYAATRLIEVALIVLGLAFTLSSATPGSDAAFLLGWDVLAVSYLATGFVLVRRRRWRPDPIRPDGALAGRLLTGARLNFAFTIAASLVGIGTAGAVLDHGTNASYGQAIRFFGTVAIVCAWLLLHAGYARFYARRYYTSAGSEPGLEFPRSAAPTATDFLYFSFTLGTSFAVSDVNVTNPQMRWHVMVHSVLSFFYNAIVLALAVGILTGR
jgi:uncharacterized membrane protein